MGLTRITSIVILGAGALSLSACGAGGSSAASRPQPPAPVVVSALVGHTQVRVSPTRLHPGPVLLTVVNQSPRSVAVVVARRAHSAVIARTAPLKPQGVTQVQFTLRHGAYTVAAARSGHRSDAQRSEPGAVAAATLRVAGAADSAGDQVLTP